MNPKCDYLTTNTQKPKTKTHTYICRATKNIKGENPMGMQYIYILHSYICYIMISEVKFNDIEEVRRMTVRKMGNAAHVYLPKDWIDKEIIVLLVNDDD